MRICWRDSSIKPASLKLRKARLTTSGRAQAGGHFGLRGPTLPLHHIIDGVFQKLAPAAL
ncbi:MAG: hypothetical protein R3A44_25685 [Caldilineaceae bacterium]